MIKQAIILIFILASLTGSAKAIFEETHPGRFCAGCHAIVTCSGTLCHPSDDNFDYRARHTQPDTCGRCHGKGFAGQNVHLTHENKVKCDICHNPPENFTSTKAVIPKQDRKDGFIIPKSGQCSYCHSVGGSGLHGIHKPILEGKCPKCHGEGFSPDKATVARVTGKTPPITVTAGNLAVEIPKIIFSPIKILTDLFNSIAKAWMEILT